MSRILKSVARSRILRWGVIGGTGVYAWDQTLNDRALSRALRSVYTVSLIGIDYQLNFNKDHDVTALNIRNAKRLHNLLVANKGMYIKVGQSIAIQASMLPDPYQEYLSQLFDDAPQDSWEQCQQTLRAEYHGKDPTELFEYIDKQAVASASIAQVHKARLRSNGKEVAVKIQHADVRKSVWWDLNTYKGLMWVWEKFIFKIPIHFVAKYIADQVERETDFRIELDNAKKMANFVASDSTYRDSVHIPNVYPEYSTSRVLVMEWIDGVSLSKPDLVRAKGFNATKALTTIFDILTKETFVWGFVHCDPHPGNWIIRKSPVTGKQQLVMLDHGMYITMSPKLRSEYSQLWRAMFTNDSKKIAKIVYDWGFNQPELFVAGTMLQNPKSKRPEVDDGSTVHEKAFEREEKGAMRIKMFLRDTERIPLELILIGRTQRILQGLNRIYGSPVNRIRIIVDGALTAPDNTSRSLPSRLGQWIWRKFLVFLSDIVYTYLRLQQYLTKESLEDTFDEELKNTATHLLD